MLYVSPAMIESGADGINLDTTGAAGDPDFLAPPKAAEILKKKSRVVWKRKSESIVALGIHSDFDV